MIFLKKENIILGQAEYVNSQHINTYSHILDIMCYLEQLRSVLMFYLYSNFFKNLDFLVGLLFEIEVSKFVYKYFNFRR